jgi:hypothetical protein
VTLGKGILRTATEEFLLSSRYKPHDPLAAEFIRTFRSQNFNGKFYLERYEALCKNDALVEVRVLLPKNAAGKGAVDVAALYGFRSTAPDLFFLSPWEFVQWILPERLQPPSATNVITKWTLAGKKKLSQKTKGAAMEAGVDYELDMTAVKNLADLFPFPDDMRLFGKPHKKSDLKVWGKPIPSSRSNPILLSLGILMFTALDDPERFPEEEESMGSLLKQGMGSYQTISNNSR